MHGNEILKPTTQRILEKDQYIVRFNYLLNYLQAKSAENLSSCTYTQRPFFQLFCRLHNS